LTSVKKNVSVNSVMVDVLLDAPPGFSAKHEGVQSPEAPIGEIIQEVDRVFDKAGDPRVAGGRKGVCNLAVDLVKRAAENKGFDAKSYQAMDVHESLGGRNIDSFGHGFNIVTVGGKKFLVDISFCQFIDPQTHEIKEGQQVSGRLEDSPVASALLNLGYVELTGASLEDYLRITNIGSKVHLQKVSVDSLDQLAPLKYDYEMSELDGWLSGRVKLYPMDEARNKPTSEDSPETPVA
jgi:hypothetical protein